MSNNTLNIAIKDFIKERSSLFWYIPEKDKENIDENVLVEFVLNYGNDKDVKQLFELIGLNEVAAIFKKQHQSLRHNYFKQVSFYFNLYFKKYASNYIE